MKANCPHAWHTGRYSLIYGKLIVHRQCALCGRVEKGEFDLATRVGRRLVIRFLQGKQGGKDK